MCVSARMANWLWRTGSYGELTMANRQMTKRLIPILHKYGNETNLYVCKQILFLARKCKNTKSHLLNFKNNWGRFKAQYNNSHSFLMKTATCGSWHSQLIKMDKHIVFLLSVNQITIWKLFQYTNLTWNWFLPKFYLFWFLSKVIDFL